MSVKRPRINPAIASKIEEIRGSVPFERWVNDTLGEYLMTFVEDADIERRRSRYSGRHEILWNMVSSDRWQMDWKDFEADVARARELWQAEMDQQAREDEFEFDNN